MTDVNPNHLETVTRILAGHVPECEVRAFGSRVTWTAKDYSDLDLAVVGESALDLDALRRLKEAFEESDLPFRVDVLDWHAISAAFQKVIEKKSEVVQKGKKKRLGLAGEWRSIPFEQVLAEPVRNGIYKQKAFHGRGAKIVNIGELFANPRLRAIPMKRVELSSSETERFMLAQGDLLFARRSLTAEGVGKCSVVLDLDEPTTFESSIIRARPDRLKAEPLYLYYFLNSSSGINSLDAIHRQVAVAGITGSDLSRLEILVPRLPEQRAIAHILGTLDDKIELNRRMNETLEAMTQALFKSWFVDFDPVCAKMEDRDPGLPQPLADLFPDSFKDSELGEIPKGWEVSDIGTMAEVTSGKRPTEKYSEPSDHASVPLWGGHGPMAHVTGSLYDQPILLTGRVGTLGSVFRIAAPCWPSDNTLVLLPRHRIDLEYLFLQLHRVDFAAYNRGSTQPLLTQTDLKVQRVVVPPSALLRRFHGVARDGFAKVDSTNSECQTLAALRDALLPRLISGELRVKDAEKFIGRAV